MPAEAGKWFNERWEDRWCLDISQELADIIDDSWARQEMLPPYYIYLKMAYHLSEEARTGLQDFRIPRDFQHQLFDYQVAAVKIAAHHLNKRGGVLIGDVVGLGKTLMATALARIMQDDYGTETLVLCPKNLVKMWREYLHDYHLVGEVRAVSNVHERTAAPAPFSRGDYRRKPQPAQPRGATLQGHQGLHREEREQVHPAFSDALQQDVSRPLGPTAPLPRGRAGQRPGYPSRKAAQRARRKHLYHDAPVSRAFTDRL